MMSVLDFMINWDLFKGNAKGGKAYVGFCELLHNKNHILLSEYIDTKTKVLIDFNCRHEPHWITPNGYKSGGGCPKCAIELRAKTKKDKAKEKLINLINENGHILLSEYMSSDEKVLIDFNCGHEPHWITPSDYKKGCRCPKCVGNCLKQAREDLINLINKNGHKLLSEYKNTDTKVLIDFNCGHEPHWIKPEKYKSGKGCPLCKNKGESALYELLVNMGYEVERQKKYDDLKDKKLLPYDFYLPKYNLLIELDGDHHYKPILYTSKKMTDKEKDMEELDAFLRFYDRKEKDRLKDDYAKNNNIPLLRIKYSDSKIELDKWKELILNKINEMMNEEKRDEI